MFTLPDPPGFRGLSRELPVTTYRRNLPHWRQAGATYFVTFRLNDSLPAAALGELKKRRERWEHDHPPPHSKEDLEELARMLSTTQERWLDQGHGECLLRGRVEREIVIGALRYFDEGRDVEARYQLGAWVVMPNHVHLIVRPMAEDSGSLETILHSWKRFSAREINRLNNRTGALWFEESYDRIIRDTEHLYRCVQYIGSNPAKAGISARELRWLRPSWRELRWEFDMARG